MKFSSRHQGHPNAHGIGPYGGKETSLLTGALINWALLHLFLRKRDMKLAAPVVVFVAGMALAPLLVYTPFMDFILGK